MHSKTGILAAAALVGSMHVTGALAWGQEGHSIVAEIAQHRLTPAAQAVVNQIFGPGVSLASVSSWADDYRADNHPETFNWHFVDIPATADAKYDPARDCKPDPKMGDCVVAEIDRLKTVLADPTVSATDKRMPLMFLVHFIGDMSQPLHCTARDNDQGGNLYYVTFNGHKEHVNMAVTLHSIWDTTLILDQVYDWGAMVMTIEADTIPQMDVAKVDAGTTADWANDCHDAGVAAYAALGASSPPTDDKAHPLALTTAYADATLPMLKQQLAKGGLHLAQVLNTVFK